MSFLCLDLDTSEEDTELSSVYLVVAIVGFFILAFILVVLILAIRKQQVNKTEI